MSVSRWVHIEVALIIAETAKAFLCRIEGQEEDVWLPKSQIADAGDYEEGDEDVTLSITEYIAREKELL